MTKAQLDIPLEALTSFAQRWKIRELSLFGSVLRDDFRPDSDVDVLVSFLPVATWDYWYGWEEMHQELRSIFDRNVHLVIKETLKNPFRRHEILRTHEVIYSAPGT